MVLIVDHNKLPCSASPGFAGVRVEQETRLWPPVRDRDRGRGCAPVSNQAERWLQPRPGAGKCQRRRGWPGATGRGSLESGPEVPLRLVESARSSCQLQGWRISGSLKRSTTTRNQSRLLKSYEGKKVRMVVGRIYRPPGDRSGPDWPWPRALSHSAEASWRASACFCSSGRPTRLRGSKLLISAARAEAV